jgi:hypothetical protein
MGGAFPQQGWLIARGLIGLATPLQANAVRGLTRWEYQWGDGLLVEITPDDHRTPEAVDITGTSQVSFRSTMLRWFVRLGLGIVGEDFCSLDSGSWTSSASGFFRRDALIAPRPFTRDRRDLLTAPTCFNVRSRTNPPLPSANTVTTQKIILSP